MSSELVLGIRSNSQNLTTIKLRDINLKNRVEDLRYKTAAKVNLSKESFGEKINSFLIKKIHFSNLSLSLNFISF